MPPSDIFNWKDNSSKLWQTEIEVEYVHNLKELYKRMHVWLEEYGYKDFYGDGNYETLYWQREIPAGLTEHHIWWRCYRQPGIQGIPQDAFTWFFKINFQTLAVSKAEVMHKGKKWKQFQSDTILRIEGHLIREWENDFEKHGLLKRIAHRWREWIYKDKVSQAEDAFFRHCMAFQDMIKAFLQVRAETEQVANIYPPDALP